LAPSLRKILQTRTGSDGNFSDSRYFIGAF